MKTIEEDYCKKQAKKCEINKQREEFVNEFLASYSFFYVPQTELFIEHANTYSIVTEDYIVHLIGTKLDKTLSPFKFKIIQSILKKCKDNLFVHATTDVDTTKRIVKSLPFSKECAKYFLVILGDFILNKRDALIYYTDTSYKPFLKSLNQSIYFILNKSMDVFKHKYYDHKYELCRVIAGICPDYELPCAICVIVSAIHLSTRYGNSDGFIASQPDSFVQDITILKRHTPTSLIQLFLETNTAKEFGVNILYKDVYFLWKSFLRQHFLPFVVSQQNLKTVLIQLSICDGEICANRCATVQTNLLKFKNFWEKFFVYDEDSFYELHEVADLYAKHDKSIISFDTIKEVLVEYPIIIENDCILNVKCSLWNKSIDIDNAMELFKHRDYYSSNIDDMYAFYSEYIQLHHKRAVSTDFFEKYFE